MYNLSAERNHRVLVVDDNPAIHADFRKILSPAASTAADLDASELAVFGHSAVPAQQIQFEMTSAFQALEGLALVEKATAAGRPYALAFVDVRMPPGMDGVEAARKIWELDPQLQIVLCTAYSDYSWAEIFERLGQRDGLLILKKPFDAVEAIQLAHALTEKWWLHSQLRQNLHQLEGLILARTHELQAANERLQSEIAERSRTEAVLGQA